jgi:hypothetical protein
VVVLAGTDEPWMLPSIARLLPAGQGKFTRFHADYGRCS